MRNSRTHERSRSSTIARFHLRGLALVVVTLIGVWVCGCGSNQSGGNQSSPNAPTITSISPNTIIVGGTAFTLTITGTNFVAASTVTFGGASPATAFVSSTELTATIPASSIASTGNLAVTVSNPAPDAGTSNRVNFSVTNGSNPVAMITNLFPNCSPAGEQFVDGTDNMLTVVGSNFVPDSVVRWNGSDRPTSGNGSINAVVAQIPASDIAAAGTAQVTVFNPGSGGGTSNSLAFTITPGAVAPQSIAVDPAGKFAYVASAGCGGYVSMYTINPTTGVLASIGPPLTTSEEFTDAVTVDPSGKFVYVASSGDIYDEDFGTVATYTINPTTGALTSTNGGTSGTGTDFCCFNSLAANPLGKFVYVADGGALPAGSYGGTDNVSMYAIDGTSGALSSTGTISAGSGPASVTVDPTGKFAYVANFNSNNVSMYSINPTTGALTSAGTIAAGTAPVSVAVDPASKFAYVANWTQYNENGSVSMYSIDPSTGVLTSIGTISTGIAPISVAVAPVGTFVYVANSGSNDVSMFSFDAMTGALTLIGTIATELAPTSIAVHPSGKFAYVTNAGSNSVSMYSIDAATGNLTLIGTVGS